MKARRSFLFRAAAAMVAITPSSFAQPPDSKPVRIGYLSHTSPDTDGGWLAAFVQGLRDLGYEEGRNIRIERRHASGQSQKLSQLAKELVSLQPRVIVTYGGIEAIKTHSATVPIVMTVHADPVRAGIIASLAKPGGQVTGLSDQHADLAAKRLELLKEANPPLARAAVLFNPAGQVIAGSGQLKDLMEAAPKLGLSVLQFPVRDKDEIARAFAAMAKERIGGVVMIGDAAVLGLNRALIIELALKHRFPAIGTIRSWGEGGLLMSYGTDFHELWRRAATYVDKILKGAKAADLPVEQPTRFELVVNVKTARALGITLPKTVLVRADRIVE